MVPFDKEVALLQYRFYIIRHGSVIVINQSLNYKNLVAIDCLF